MLIKNFLLTKKRRYLLWGQQGSIENKRKDIEKMDNNKKEFKPYIPADKVVPEFTVTALLIGILLAIVFGAANAYLGLFPLPSRQP